MNYAARTACPSEPLYIEYVKHVLENVMNYLTPKYLHIGHDELMYANTDTRCQERHMSNAAIFAADIESMRQWARDIDPGVRIMMWGDTTHLGHMLHTVE